MKDEITERIIGSAFAVSNVLGTGFLEKVYENALAFELRSSDLRVVQQAPITVLYRGAKVGDYVADLVVEGRVMVELKAAKGIDPIHQAQLLNWCSETASKVEPSVFIRVHLWLIQ